MWTTDVVGAVICDYCEAAEPSDYLFCTPEQEKRIRADKNWAVDSVLDVHGMPSRGRHSRPELFADPDRKGRIVP